jgi:hypothetical protein
MTKNVIRVSWNGNDLRHVVGTPFVTSYGKGRDPVKVNITKPSNRDFLYGFVAVALLKNKGPSQGLIRNTNKNQFGWTPLGHVVRNNLTANSFSNLNPEKNFTIEVGVNMLLSKIAA